jgi:hypothetical protein
MLLNSFVVFFISINKIIIRGIMENITAPIKNNHLFQKIAPSIFQKSKNANKFSKIKLDIFKNFLYIYF